MNSRPDNPSVPGDDSVPIPLAFFVLCHDCADAQYDNNGNLLNSADLNKVPTSVVVLIPSNWNQKLIVQIPPGSFTQTFFESENAALVKEGYALATMFHTGPPSVSFDLFSDPLFHPRGQTNAYFSTGHFLKSMTAELFAPPLRTLSLAHSRGVLRGTGLLAGRPGAPFDGYLMVEGANGMSDFYDTLRETFATDNRVAITCLFPREVNQTPAQKASLLAGLIGSADPEYKEEILNELTLGNVSTAYNLALGYDVTTRENKTQQAWGSYEFPPDIQFPVLIVVGGRDVSAHPRDTLKHAERIVDAGKEGSLRVFIFKNMGHARGQFPDVTAR